jgi:hypothetical protein
MTVIEEVFLLLQRHLSSLCNNLQQEVTSATLYSLHWTSSKFLSQDIEYMYCLMKAIYYNFIEWPATTTREEDTNTNESTAATANTTATSATTAAMTSTIIVHSPLFWCQFPLFTKMILQRHPEIAFIYDINGNLPLHVVVHYNWACSCSSSEALVSATTKKNNCFMCKKSIEEGLFHWFEDTQALHCSHCQTKYKRQQHSFNTSIMSNANSPPRIPYVLCHGKSKGRGEQNHTCIIAIVCFIACTIVLSFPVLFRIQSIFTYIVLFVCFLFQQQVSDLFKDLLQINPLAAAVPDCYG